MLDSSSGSWWENERFLLQRIFKNEHAITLMGETSASNHQVKYFFAKTRWTICGDIIDLPINDVYWFSFLYSRATIEFVNEILRWTGNFKKKNPDQSLCKNGHFVRDYARPWKKKGAQNQAWKKGGLCKGGPRFHKIELYGKGQKDCHPQSWSNHLSLEKFCGLFILKRLTQLKKSSM